jgi:hypothetical protein
MSIILDTDGHTYNQTLEYNMLKSQKYKIIQWKRKAYSENEELKVCSVTQFINCCNDIAVACQIFVSLYHECHPHSPNSVTPADRSLGKKLFHIYQKYKTLRNDTFQGRVMLKKENLHPEHFNLGDVIVPEKYACGFHP